jgi:hypothetical protein
VIPSSAAYPIVYQVLPIQILGWSSYPVKLHGDTLQIRRYTRMTEKLTICHPRLTDRSDEIINQIHFLSGIEIVWCDISIYSCHVHQFVVTQKTFDVASDALACPRSFIKTSIYPSRWMHYETVVSHASYRPKRHPSVPRSNSLRTTLNYCLLHYSLKTL